MISPACKTCLIYGMGWCEYDFQTDQLMPHDPENCPALIEEDKQGGM